MSPQNNTFQSNMIDTILTRTLGLCLYVVAYFWAVLLDSPQLAQSGAMAVIFGRPVALLMVITYLALAALAYYRSRQLNDRGPLVITAVHLVCALIVIVMATIGGGAL